MDHTPLYVHAEYLDSIIRTDKLANTIAKMAEGLRQYNFDAIAFTGVSGMLIGPSLALALNKTMLVVRKEVSGNMNSDGSPFCHSSRIVEGDYGARRYVVVDECFCTGQTYKKIQIEIKKVSQAQCIGLMVSYDVLGSLQWPGGTTELRIPEPMPAMYRSQLNFDQATSFVPADAENFWGRTMEEVYKQTYRLQEAML